MTTRIAVALAAGASAMLASTDAWAQNANVTINLNAAGRAAAQGIGLDVGQFEQLLEDQISALYGVSDLATFLQLSANAQSMVNKGIGVDYASNPNGFLFGVSVSGALDAGNADIEDIENLDFVDFDRAVPVGVGAQISLMVGYNFSSVGLPGLTLFANGLAFPLQYEEYQADFRNFGVHAQYKLFGPQGNQAGEWGGLDITSGLQFSETVLDLDEQIDRALSLVGSTGSLNVGTEVTGDLELVQTAWTIPLEVTSNVRFLYILSLYGGVGVDFQFGSASMNADLESPLDQGDTNIGTATVVANDAADPSSVLFRFLVGTQVNLGPIKLWGQLNFLTENLTVGGAAGVRAVF
jgi:hypothetical protein